MPFTNSEWLCYPAYHGLAIVRPTAAASSPRFGGEMVQTFLPASDEGAEDRVLAGELPLSIRLTDEEYRLLTVRTHDLAIAAAGTIYGPSNQDKQTNEDFALSTVLTSEAGEEYAFGAVADGVSTKTFWAARTSRIACLIAFREIRRHIQLARPLETLESLRGRLCESLRTALASERDFLRRHGAVPPGWSLENYGRYQERDELWFNSTLLLGCLGETGGLVVWAGDGGICLRKIPSSNLASPSTNMVLQSKEESTITSFVSLRVKETDFQAARVHYDDVSAVDLYLSSDGVDRTLQRNPSQKYQDFILDSGIEARTVLESMVQLPLVEHDNFSIAHLGRSLSAVSSLKASSRKPKQTTSERAIPTENVKAARDFLIAKPPPPSPRLIDIRNRAPIPRAVIASPGAAKRRIATHSAAFLAGAALAVCYLSFLQPRIDRLYPAPAPKRLPKQSQAPKPAPVLSSLPTLVLSDNVGAATKRKQSTPEIQDYVNRSLIAIRTDRRPVYSVVAYADRKDDSPKDCEDNATTSLARSTYVASLIVALAEKEKLQVKIEAHHDVCDAPDGVESFRLPKARQLVLKRGSLINCKCR